MSKPGRKPNLSARTVVHYVDEDNEVPCHVRSMYSIEKSRRLKDVTCIYCRRAHLLPAIEVAEDE